MVSYFNILDDDLDDEDYDDEDAPVAEQKKEEGNDLINYKGIYFNDDPG